MTKPPTGVVGGSATTDARTVRVPAAPDAATSPRRGFAYSAATSSRPRRLHSAGRCGSDVLYPPYIFVTAATAAALLTWRVVVPCRTCRPEVGGP